MYQFLYSKLARSSCVLCDDRAPASMNLCPACLANLPVNSPCCQTCALPLLTNAQQSYLQCGSCLLSNGPITESVIPYLYRPPTDFMIRRLKYGSEPKYGRLIGELLFKSIQERCTALPDLLIPIPLHSSRYRKRGFNQAQIIAHHLSTHLHIPLNDSAAKRVVEGEQQAALGAHARSKNMHGAFSVVSSPEHSLVEGKTIAIVDDVYTTGATCLSLARSLLAAGAIRIDAWAFARTP